MTIHIGLLGCGTVGSGVAKLLTEKADFYAHRCNQRIELKKVLVRDKDKQRAIEIAPELLTLDADEVLNDPIFSSL